MDESPAPDPELGPSTPSSNEYGIGSAFPHHEKDSRDPANPETSQDPSHREGFGPPPPIPEKNGDSATKTEDSNGGPASAEQLRTLQAVGVGGKAPVPPESRPSDVVGQDATNGEHKETPQPTEPIERYRQPKDGTEPIIHKAGRSEKGGDGQHRQDTTRRGRVEARSAKADPGNLGEPTTPLPERPAISEPENSVVPVQHETEAVAAPSSEKAAGPRSEALQKKAEDIFRGYKSGKQYFRLSPAGPKYTVVAGSLDTPEGGEPSLRFAPHDGGEEIQRTIPELWGISNVRAGLPEQAPLPPIPQPEITAPKEGLIITPEIRKAAELHGFTPEEWLAKPFKGRVEIASARRDAIAEQNLTNQAVRRARTQSSTETPANSGKTSKEKPPPSDYEKSDTEPPTKESADKGEENQTTASGSSPPPKGRETATGGPEEDEFKEDKTRRTSYGERYYNKIQELIEKFKKDGYDETLSGHQLPKELRSAAKRLGIDKKFRESTDSKDHKKIYEVISRALDDKRITRTQKTPAPASPELDEQIEQGQEEARAGSQRMRGAVEGAGKFIGGGLKGTRKAEEFLTGKAEKADNKYTRFLYNAGAGFLNRFRWADKEQGTYAIGVGFGAATSILLGPAGNIVKIPTLIGLNGIVVPGINFARVRLINNVLKDYIEDSDKRSEAARQYDNAFRLMRPDNKEDFDNEINRLAKEYATRGDVIGQSRLLGLETLQERMESLSKFTKAQSHIRSFAAGLSAGSITASAGVAIFHGISSWIGGGGGSTAEGGAPPGEAPTNTPTPVGEQATATPTPIETPGGEAIPTTEIGISPEGIDQATWENFTEGQRDGIQYVIDNPDRQEDFVKYITAAQEGTASIEVLGQAQEIMQNPDFTQSMEIAQGTTVSEMLANNGYDITWTTDDADIFGGHVLTNYEELQQMHEQVKAAGIPVEFQDYPSPQEVVNLIKAAEGGDAAAFQQLVAASHWIPAGGSFNILTESGFEALKQKYGLA